jgi:hypothetical protein
VAGPAVSRMPRQTHKKPVIRFWRRALPTQRAGRGLPVSLLRAKHLAMLGALLTGYFEEVI